MSAVVKNAYLNFPELNVMSFCLFWLPNSSKPKDIQYSMIENRTAAYPHILEDGTRDYLAFSLDERIKQLLFCLSTNR